ncbi:4-coumarate-CoA ligase 2 [Cordyceps militaris CM01]|uniref:4-coumarate-CoA ligase 2 n=1 Tax=Cordyceps militaris (strain CM01) TaxID=983644 RepID=G3JIC5_CORMM|nr:4-coumarate-CoA ligase 2 [Cordyceps militaris CM01]EGX91875.1 4-coumarate-CoA ligase 2 [Cordyceps militaris CM01]
MPVRSQLPDVEIPEVNVLDYIFPDPSDVSDKPLWIDADDTTKSLSLRQTLGWVRRLGAGLQRIGLRPSDVVMMCSTNHIFVPVLYLGVVGATCAFTGANPAYTPKEIAYQISNAKAKLILVHPSKMDDVLAAAAEASFPRDRIFHFSDDVSGRATNPHGLRDWTSFLGPESAGTTWQWPSLSGAGAARTQLATINYSSGTTGLPKGVCGAHRNLVANVQQLIGLRHPDGLTLAAADDVWLAFLPLYHAYGQMYTILMAARRRVTVYVMSVFNFERYLQCIERFRPNVLQVVPPVVVMLSKRPEVARYDLSSVRDVMCGAAPLKAELQNEVADRFRANVVQGWGMTELTCAASSLPTGHVDRKASCGMLLPNCEAKFLDEQGNEVAVGEPGELFVRGPNVMLGYWQNEQATKETLEDGWLRTGDVAVYNEQGMLWIVDRKKELIKVNGLQVAPAELESLLLENEHIADAAVVGIELDNEEWPRAYVHIQDVSKGKVQPRDIQDWLAARVSKHKHLIGGVSFVDAIPKLASGKIVRKLLREWSKRDAAAMSKAGWSRSKL